MKWMKPIGNIIIPTALFYIVYHAMGVIPAIMISLLQGIAAAIYAKHRKIQMKNSQKIGILGLVGSAIVILFTGEEKLYYVPAMLENMVFLGFMVALSIRRKSVLHYLAKDFDIKALDKISEERLLRVNLIWMVYFLLKIVSKMVGILYLNFRELYWLVFLLGDPMTILVIVLSVVFVRADSGNNDAG